MGVRPIIRLRAGPTSTGYRPQTILFPRGSRRFHRPGRSLVWAPFGGMVWAFAVACFIAYIVFRGTEAGFPLGRPSHPGLPVELETEDVEALGARGLAAFLDDAASANRCAEVWSIAPDISEPRLLFENLICSHSGVRSRIVLIPDEECRLQDVVRGLDRLHHRGYLWIADSGALAGLRPGSDTP